MTDFVLRSPDEEARESIGDCLAAVGDHCDFAAEEAFEREVDSQVASLLLLYNTLRVELEVLSLRLDVLRRLHPDLACDLESLLLPTSIFERKSC